MTFDPAAIARPEILEMEAYQSARSLGEPSVGSVFLDANENPFDTDGSAASPLNRYPEPQPARLLSLMSRFYGADERSLLVTRGSDDGIELLVRAFCRPQEDAVLICPPTFGFYRTAAEIQGARVLEAPLTSEFSLDKDRILEMAAAGNAKILFLCSPNNPTGNADQPDTLVEIAEALPETLVVVDEAYIEFANTPSLATKVSDQGNVVILRTLSKAFGLAGARCGALIGNPVVVDILKKIIAPYPVPAPVAELAIAALSPVGLARLDYHVQEICKMRDALAVALLEKASVIEVCPSAANFLLVRPLDKDAALARLRRRGILVRDPGGILSDYLRISVGNEADNSLLLEALAEDAEPQIGTRRCERTRNTSETQIFVAVDLNGRQSPDVSTGIEFFDHMLEQLGLHGAFSLTLKCEGDLSVDAHHTVEDCMIALGEAIAGALGDKRGIARYGFHLPMDEAMAEVLIDLSGRALSKFEGKFTATSLGGLPTEMICHAFRSLADGLKCALHVNVAGDNDHHKAEACFKAVGRALGQAIRIESENIPSTKGQL